MVLGRAQPAAAPERDGRRILPRRSLSAAFFFPFLLSFIADQYTHAATMPLMPPSP